MKNPRIVPNQLQESLSRSLTLPNEVKDGLSTFGDGLTGGKSDPAGIGKNDFEGLEKVLRRLKFTDQEIERITELVATVAAVASVVGWVVAAISTIKQVLSFVGILGSKDPVMTALKAIGERVEAIYSYLKYEERKGLYSEAQDYRTKINDIRNDIGNLALSRSETALTTIVGHVQYLQEKIEKMLAPGNAEIVFLRQLYGYGGLTFPASHWVDVATPFYMHRTDATSSGVDYQDPSRDLAATIWDPGHYLDLVIPAIAVRLAALEVTEPAFRSTGWDRQDLQVIFTGLKNFIDKWNSSFFVTSIVGPIDPRVDPVSGGHRIHQNPLAAFIGYSSPSIALGFIDPVSGLAILEPEYADGFALRQVVPGGQSSPYWVIDNYDQVIAKAYERQSAMMEVVRAHCGINSFYELMHSVFSLINLTRSEFVELTDAKFASNEIRLLDPVENLDLGIIGAFAGKPGKKYQARRYHQHVMKRFRIPMARRTDSSRVQLGYRMVVSVGGLDEVANVILCPFSRLNSPLQTVEMFPSGTRTAAIDAQDAVVYDVIQSGVFSVAEEDAFEESGSVPKKRRIYVNPRAGSARLQIDVTFDFNISDNDHPFFGYADVEVSSVDVDANANGFIASVEVYETVPPFDATTDEPPRELLADVLALHFAPSFLVAPAAYFTDRDAGFAAMDDSFGKISDEYAKSSSVGGIDPIARVSRQAQVERTVATFAEEQLRNRPREMKTILARFQSREPSTVLNRD